MSVLSRVGLWSRACRSSLAPSLFNAARTLPSRRIGCRSFSEYKTPTWKRLWTNDWVEAEAEILIARAYAQHRALIDTSSNPPPPLTTQELETLGRPYPTYEPQNIGDKIAASMVRCLTPFTHWFFREHYNHHAVVLETVAAVPGMVAGMFRHLRSLRHMSRDYGWISTLLEDAENERMHLLTWMTVTQPTILEKGLVMLAQGGYFVAFSILYILAPGTAHRFVGYLEEEAVKAYTEYLEAIDNGALKNGPAPEIAKRYWSLGDDATIRDVVLRVRADECFHRNMNHYFAEMIRQGIKDEEPAYPPDLRS